MTTNLPSAAVFCAQLPLAPNFDFRAYDVIANLIAHPERYDRVLIDPGRLVPTLPGGGDKNYWIEDFLLLMQNVTRITALYTLQTTIRVLLSQSKNLTIYLGGIHADNEEYWKTSVRMRNTESKLYKIFQWFDEFKGNPNFHICIDGMGDAHQGTVQMLVYEMLCCLGYDIVVEGAAWPENPLFGVSSITTLSAAGKSIEKFLEIASDKLHDGVLVHNNSFIGDPTAAPVSGADSTLNDIPMLRRLGYPIYLPAHILKPTIPLPAYWDAATDAVIGGVA